MSGVLGLGHAGWAYRTRLTGKTEQWTIGATENRTGNWYLPPDPKGWNNDTWQRTGLSPQQAVQVFKTGKNTRSGKPGGKDLVKPGEYRSYRCQDTVNINLNTSNSKYVQSRHNGFFGIGNNCLTKAVSILRGYGSTAPGAPADLNSPNVYIYSLLDGFLPVAFL